MSIPWTQPNVFGIEWDNGPNTPASPLTEITRDEFLKLFFCGAWGLDGLNYGGYAPLPGETREQSYYQWHYYFFHREALAVATRYGWGTDQVRGEFLPDKQGTNGHDVKFYLLGCQHPNMKVAWPRMHDRQDTCPDCNFTANYDSSG